LPLSKPNTTLELLLHVNATNPVSLRECHHRLLSLAQQFFLFLPNKGDQGSCGDNDDDDGDVRSLFHITSGNKSMA
jgi:hypothetical protein